MKSNLNLFRSNGILMVLKLKDFLLINSLIIATTAILSACATQALKAPCDMHATFCGSKTKINQ